MAEVWLARRVGFEGADKPCALKLPLPHLAADPRFRRMFLAEARLLSRLRHCGIVSAFDVGCDGPRPFIAMEWIEGVDLAEFGARLRGAGEPMPVAVAAHITGELLDALDYVHTFCVAGRPQRIVHRDISPHNVLISAAGEVKLLDFGIARACHDETSQPGAKGKLRYMAPEQLRGRATQRSDLFAVGAVLHEMLSGGRYREGQTEDSLYGRIFDPVIPTLRRPDVPPQIDALRRDLLAARADDRPPSADAALRRLAQWPEYRNARLDLRWLYRAGQRDPSAPRASGLTQSVSLSLVSAPAPLAPTRVTAGRDPPLPTTTWRATARTRRWRRRVGLGLALALPALTGSIAASSTPLVTPPPPSPRSAASPAPATTRAPAPVQLQPAATHRAPPHVPASTPVPSAPRPRIPLQLRLDFVDWAEVEVGGRRIAVDPRADVRIPPGRYRVRVRTEPGGPWHSAGRLRLSARAGHQLRIRRGSVQQRDL
jgi:serine/threonine protein kinase